MLRQTKKHFKYDKDFAQEYSQHTNFHEVYDFFVNSFVEIHGEPSGSLIDLCCGTADIAAEFKLKFPSLDVFGYDESCEMLDSADHTGITLINKPIKLVNGIFDNIISNNAYHHFDTIDDFWNVVNRISHAKSKILISDVVRPDHESDVEQIVEDVLGKDSVFASSFTLSLTASYTEYELKKHIGLLNLVIIDTPFKNYKLFLIHN
jgi:ubiquinone/menaquinone biosynthesis C-methylase UbiE